MPSVSEKQAHFMAAAAHSKPFAEKAGISQNVAKEFNAADTGHSIMSHHDHKNERDHHKKMYEHHSKMAESHHESYIKKWPTYEGSENEQETADMAYHAECAEDHRQKAEYHNYEHAFTNDALHNEKPEHEEGHTGKDALRKDAVRGSKEPAGGLNQPGGAEKRLGGKQGQGDRR